MANFPIQYSDQSPSGRGSGVTLPMSSVDRTGEIIGDSLMRLGNVGMDEAIKWNRLNADTKLMEATKAAGDRLAQLAREADDEMDAEQYGKLYDAAIADIKATRPEGKLAGRMWDQWYSQNEPSWAMGLAKSQKTRIAKTALLQKEEQERSFIDKATAIARSDPEEAYLYAQDKVQSIRPERRQDFVDRVNRQIVFGSMSKDPDKTLAWLDAHQDDFQGDDYLDLRWRAERQKAQNEFDIDYATDEEIRKARLQAVGMIDNADPQFNTFLDSVRDILPERAGSKDVGPKALALWRSNRNRLVTTDYRTKLSLMGKVLNGQRVDESILELADARYGEDGKLSQEDYDSLRDFLAKGYKPDEIDTLRSGYNVVRSMKTKYVDVQGIMGGWAMKVEDPSAQSRIMDSLISWYDSKRDKGNAPDPIETVTYARKIAAAGEVGMQDELSLKGKMGTNEGEEETRKQKLMEGLSDQDRDAVTRLLQTMSVDEFMKKYGVTE